MRKEEIPLRDALGLLGPSPLVMVTTEVRGRPNVSTIAWIMPAGSEPPTVILSLAPDSLTRRNIEDQGEFIINIPGRDLVREAAFCGSVSGHEVQKLKECGLKLEPGGKVRAPLLSGCPAHLECKATASRAVAGQILVEGEIVLALAGRDIFEAGRGWNLDNPEARFLLHLGESFYASPDRRIEVDPRHRPSW